MGAGTRGGGPRVRYCGGGRGRGARATSWDAASRHGWAVRHAGGRHHRSFPQVAARGVMHWRHKLHQQCQILLAGWHAYSLLLLSSQECVPQAQGSTSSSASITAAAAATSHRGRHALLVQLPWAVLWTKLGWRHTSIGRKSRELFQIKGI